MHQDDDSDFGNAYCTGWLTKRSEQRVPQFDHTFLDIFDDGSAPANASIAVAAWGCTRNGIYLAAKWHMDLKSARDAVVELNASMKPGLIVVDERSTGSAMYQILGAKLGEHVIRWQPGFSEMVRLEASLAMVDSGRLWIPVEAPWADELVAEVRDLPNSATWEHLPFLSRFPFYSRSAIGCVKAQSRRW